MYIRKIKLNDCTLMLDFFSKLVLLSPERVERPEDVKKISIENEIKWIKNRIEKEKEKEIFVLCGTNDKGEIIAEAEIERMPRWIEKHVAEIRFGVLPGYENLAENITKKLISVAKKNGIKILIYFHLETQKEGIKIIKKLGFKKFGIVKRYYKRHKNYINRLYFVKYL